MAAILRRGLCVVQKEMLKVPPGMVYSNPFAKGWWTDGEDADDEYGKGDLMASAGFSFISSQKEAKEGDKEDTAALLRQRKGKTVSLNDLFPTDAEDSTRVSSEESKGATTGSGGLEDLFSGSRKGSDALGPSIAAEDSEPSAFDALFETSESTEQAADSAAPDSPAPSTKKERAGSEHVFEESEAEPTPTSQEAAATGAAQETKEEDNDELLAFATGAGPRQDGALWGESAVGKDPLDPEVAAATQKEEATWEEYLELRGSINKDILRTRQSLHFFHGDNLEAMSRILFVFAQLNPGIRYVAVLIPSNLLVYRLMDTNAVHCCCCCCCFVYVQVCPRHE